MNRRVPSPAAIAAYAHASAAIQHLPGETLDHYLDRKREAGLYAAFPILLDQYLDEALGTSCPTPGERLVQLAALSESDPALQFARERLARRLLQAVLDQHRVDLMADAEAAAFVPEVTR